MKYPSFPELAAAIAKAVEKESFVSMDVKVVGVPELANFKISTMENVFFESEMIRGVFDMVGIDCWRAHGGEKPARYRGESDGFRLNLNTGEFEAKGARVWQGGLVEDVEIATILQGAAYEKSAQLGGTHFDIILYWDAFDAPDRAEQN